MTNRMPDFLASSNFWIRMQLTRPRFSTFLVSLILALLVIASLYTHIPAIGSWINNHRFWMVAAYGILALGVVMHGL
jgi:hypothetical protein